QPCRDACRIAAPGAGDPRWHGCDRSRNPRTAAFRAIDQRRSCQGPRPPRVDDQHALCKSFAAVEGYFDRGATVSSGGVPMQTDPSVRHPVEQLADEFVARYRRGERPPIEEYTAKYPELAGEISQILQALVLMEDIGRTSDCGTVHVHHDEMATALGEYRILREIGRGGMGVVYEAVQESLGRR